MEQRPIQGEAASSADLWEEQRNDNDHPFIHTANICWRLPGAGPAGSSGEIAESASVPALNGLPIWWEGRHGHRGICAIVGS